MHHKGHETKKFVLRLPDVLFAKVAAEAKRLDLSMNEWLIAASREKLDDKELLPSVDTRCIVGFARGDESKPKPTAPELAARFGLATAAKLSEQVDNNGKEPINVGNCPVEDVAPARDWRKFYLELQEMDQTEALHEFTQATQDIKLPPGFLKMPMPKQLAWLQVNG